MLSLGSIKVSFVSADARCGAVTHTLLKPEHALQVFHPTTPNTIYKTLAQYVQEPKDELCHPLPPTEPLVMLDLKK